MKVSNGEDHIRNSQNDVGDVHLEKTKTQVTVLGARHPADTGLPSTAMARQA